MQKIFAKLFWANTGAERRKHWSVWEDLCLPMSEGGLG